METLIDGGLKTRNVTKQWAWVVLDLLRCVRRYRWVVKMGDFGSYVVIKWSVMPFLDKIWSMQEQKVMSAIINLASDMQLKCTLDILHQN